MYGITKLMGILWMSSTARQYPDRRFVSISPGATDTRATGALDTFPLVQRIMFHILVPLLSWFGNAHDVEVGAKRYVDALNNADDALPK